MPEFKKPVVLKKAERIYNKDESIVVQVQHIEYEVDGNKYPKLNFAIWRQDTDGFPSEKPKTLNLPIEMQEQLVKSLLSLK